MSKYPLWNGEIAVESMDDSYLENAARRVHEICDDIETELGDLEDWQTQRFDTLSERLAEWLRWHEIFLDEKERRHLDG